MLHHSTSADSFITDKNFICKRISKNLFIDGVSAFRKTLKNSNIDITDNPPKKTFAIRSKCTPQDSELFRSMQLEPNRMETFNGKWPISYLKPEKLAKAGFFYLQSEDNVQCAFCQIIIKNWKQGEEPHKEHIKFSPRCPFLTRQFSGMSSISSTQSNVIPLNFVSSPIFQNGGSVSYRPKHPEMADLKTRYATYKYWPHLSLDPLLLSRCGFYHTATEKTKDAVTCFFCGESLGNWEFDDNPWVEHKKFSPNCSYLQLVKHHIPAESKKMLQDNEAQSEPSPKTAKCLNRSGIEDYRRDAWKIFPPPLVETVIQRMTEKGQQVTSSYDLIEEILDYKYRQADQAKAYDEVPQRISASAKLEEKTEIYELPEDDSSISSTSSKPINSLCRICMDKEMNMCFNPCGHIMACDRCAQKIFDCPLCRQPIVNKIRFYFG